MHRWVVDSVLLRRYQRVKAEHIHPTVRNMSRPYHIDCRLKPICTIRIPITLYNLHKRLL